MCASAAFFFFRTYDIISLQYVPGFYIRIWMPGGVFDEKEKYHADSFSACYDFSIVREAVEEILESNGV